MAEPTTKRKLLLIILTAVALTLASRVLIARYLATDEPEDGRVYSQIARNMLEHRVYSIEEQAPFDPTLIRSPGYPLFIAGVYALFGHGNDVAVRSVQAAIDTLSCLLIGLIAFAWEPVEARRRKSAAAAFLLAALCPFTAIYVGIVLTETLTIFLMLATTLASTYGLTSRSLKQSSLWYGLAGLIGGLGVLVRPDAGVFVGAAGLTLLIAELSVRERERPNFARVVIDTFVRGAVLSIAFVLVLTPWAIRNYRVFHLFQPLAPAHAEMPGEFVPRGYYAWVRSWIDDSRYVEPVLWALNDQPITLDEIPEKAFDSAAEQARVSALLDRYNHPAGVQYSGEGALNGQPVEHEMQDDAGTVDGSEDDAIAESDEQDASDSADEKSEVLMTPEIDQGFAQIARERIERDSIRYYLWLPAKRAVSLWFDTHSQYYPFEGELFPLSDLDAATQQNLWLPLFTMLTWIFTLFAFTGAWALGHSRGAWIFVCLALLMTGSRLVFFAIIESPEPRYVVELFAFASILGGIGLSWLAGRLIGTENRG